jgi:hypothetical protein
MRVSIERPWNQGSDGLWPARAAGRAMSSLAETAEALLQFLEEMRMQGRTQLIAVAATRALARCPSSTTDTWLSMLGSDSDDN